MRADQIERSREQAPPYERIVAADDTDVAMIVQAVPSRGTGFAACTMAYVQGGDLTVLVDAAAPAGLDAIGTAGVIDCSAAAHDTLGELQDYFTSLAAYRAIMYAGLRADTLATILAKSAADAMGDNGLAFHSDTSASGTRTVCFSGEHFENNGKNGHKKDYDDAVENLISQIAINLDMTDAGTWAIYTGRQGYAETCMHGPFALADATALEKNLDGLVGTFYKASKRGERLILRCANDATEMGTITQFHTIGKSAVGNMSRIEDGSFLP